MSSPSTAPSAHLPGSLTRMDEVLRLEPTITQVQDLIIRLKVQAFVLIIHELFGTQPELMELAMISDDDGQSVFSSFEGDEMFENELRDASEVAERLALPSDAFIAFETQQPFQRETLAAALSSAYDGALSTEQKQRGGAWNHFWSNLVPLDHGTF